MTDDILAMFDGWIEDGSPVAALVMRQHLVSVEGSDAVIFPPTFARPQGASEQDWTGYNIDRLRNGTSVCLIDSVGSQANRMEPVFRLPEYKHLIPQLTVDAGGRTIHILDVGHRAADAAVRFAGAPVDDPDGQTLGERLWDAFISWHDSGDAELMARIAPTTCVFGAWDSRATHAKFPRIVRSVIRAYDVDVLSRSAQYNAAIQYVNEGVIDERYDRGSGDRNPLSQEGFHDNPATGSHGGVMVNGEIRRDVVVNLTALRSLDVSTDPPEGASRRLALRRYILGLSLVATTHAGDGTFNLREGCLLRLSQRTGWRQEHFDGEAKMLDLTGDTAIEYASAAASTFGVERMDTPHRFDRQRANDWLGRSKEQRDGVRRAGPPVGGAAV